MTRTYETQASRRRGTARVAAAATIAAAAVGAGGVLAGPAHAAGHASLRQAVARAHAHHRPTAAQLQADHARRTARLAAPAAASAVPTAGDPLSVVADSGVLTWHDLATGTSGTYPAASAPYDDVEDPVLSADGSLIAYAYLVQSDDGSTLTDGIAVFPTQGATAPTAISKNVNTSSSSSDTTFVQDDGATFGHDNAQAVVFARYTQDSAGETSQILLAPNDGSASPTLLVDEADSPSVDAADHVDYTPEVVLDEGTTPTDDTPLVQQIATSGSTPTTLLTYGDARAALPGGLADEDVMPPSLGGARFSSELPAAFFYADDAQTTVYSVVATLAPSTTDAYTLRVLPGATLSAKVPTDENATFAPPIQGETDLDSTGTEVALDRGTLDFSQGVVTNATSRVVDANTGAHQAALFSPADGGVSTYLPDPTSSQGSAYVPLATPYRVLDTRKGVGASKAPIGAGKTIDVQVTGAAVPDTATAVVLNLTGIAGSAPTYLQAYPTPSATQAVPQVSNVNLAKGQTLANAVTVALPTSGKLRIGNAAGSTNVIADVTGYYTANTEATGAATFSALSTPTRVLDTRKGTGGVPTAPLGSGGYVDVKVAGTSTVPADASSVVIDLGGITHGAASFLTAYPTPSTTGNTAPTTSTVSVAGTRSNLATVTVGDSGRIRVYNAVGSTDAYADVVGYYEPGPSGALFFPLAPARIYDTRRGTQTVGGTALTIGAGRTADALTGGRITTATGTPVVPTGAVAIQANATVVGNTATTFLSVYATPSGTSANPTFSSVNAPGNATTATAVITAVGSGSQSRLYNAAGSTGVILDLAGYFAPNLD